MHYRVTILLFFILLSSTINAQVERGTIRSYGQFGYYQANEMIKPTLRKGLYDRLNYYQYEVGAGFFPLKNFEFGVGYIQLKTSKYPSEREIFGIQDSYSFFGVHLKYYILGKVGVSYTTHFMTNTSDGWSVKSLKISYPAYIGEKKRFGFEPLVQIMKGYDLYDGSGLKDNFINSSIQVALFYNLILNKGSE